MSFGFSPTDIVNVVRYCWDLVEKTRGAPSEFAEIARNVEGLHSVLLAVQTEVENSESPLHRDPTTAVKLSNAVSAVRENVLPRLEVILVKFPSLATGKPKVLDRLRFPSKRELLEVRGMLAFNIQLISTHVEALQTGALGRLERLGNSQMTVLGRVERFGTFHAQAMDRVEASLDLVLPKILDFIDVFGAEARASESPSSLLSDDNQEIWATFKDRLERMGFTTATLERHEAAIIARIRELQEEGLFNSDAPSDSEPEITPQTPRYMAPYYETGSESDASSILAPRQSRPYTHASKRKTREKKRKEWEPVLSTPSEAGSTSTSDADTEGTITPTPTRTHSRASLRADVKTSKAPQKSPRADEKGESIPPPLERRSSTYSRSGSTLVSSRVELSDASASSNSRSLPKRKDTDRSGSYTGDETPRCSDFSQTSARPKHTGNKGRTPRKPPRWMYRMQKHIIPKYQSGNIESGRLPKVAEDGLLSTVQVCLMWGSHIESHGPPVGTKKDKEEHTPKTALEIAVEKGHFEIAKYLLECGARVDRVSLFEPVTNNQVEMTRLLLEYGASTGDYSGSWLHIAADMGYCALCDLFLDYGVNVNLVDDAGYTPLLLAAWQGRDLVLDLLIDEGASVHPTCEDGQNALYKASGQGHEGIVKRLLESGARPNEGRGLSGETTLFKAVSKGHIGVVRQLLDFGANPNVPNSSRKVVVVSKRSRRSKDNPYHIIHTTHGGQMPDIKSIFEKYMEKQFSIQKVSRQYPLHGAVMKQDVGVKMAKMLLAAGADVEAEDMNNARPMDYAARTGFTSMVDLLESRGSRRRTGLNERDHEGSERSGGIRNDGLEDLITEAAGYFFGKKGRSNTLRV